MLDILLFLIMHVFFPSSTTLCESGDICPAHEVIVRQTGVEGYPSEKMHLATYLQYFQFGQDERIWNLQF
jgi:hypothetical protein